MTSRGAPMCSGCVHRVPEEWRCRAYPEGIPGPIMNSEIDHRYPYPGDGGFVYSGRDAEHEEFVAWTWSLPAADPDLFDEDGFVKLADG